MSVGDRILNSISLVVSRALISPNLLPNLVARDREHWRHAAITPAGSNAASSTSDGVASSSSVVAASDEPFYSPSRALDAYPHAFRTDIPWDGIPTLMNTHWGLEHPRPMHPYEHLIGHTTAFEREARKPIPPAVEAWLRAARSVPVVYVALGTMAIVGDGLLTSLSDAFTASKGYRFLWSVKASQQHLLPAALREQTAAWFTAHGCDPVGSHCTADPSNSTSPRASLPVGAGSVLLVDWAPQLSVLMHNMTSVFLTHGGMNGVAEGTYAHTPMLCLPLFSDQPDNCQHMADYGFAIRMNPGDVTTPFVASALDALTGRNTSAGLAFGAPFPAHSYADAVHRAWIRNVAAGGIPRAVQIIEAQAHAPYGEHRHAIPRVYFLPWWQRADLDVAAFWVGLVAVLVLSAYCCVRCVVRCCCRVCRRGAGTGSSKDRSDAQRRGASVDPGAGVGDADGISKKTN